MTTCVFSPKRGVVSLKNNDDDEIQNLIDEGEQLVKDLCSTGGKTQSGFQGFALGIAGMFGLSGIKTLQAGNGRDATDFLRKANSILQQVTQYSSLAFALKQTEITTNLVTLVKTSTQSLTTSMELMNTILTEEDRLIQIEIYGVYLICSIIIFFLILLL